MTRNVRRKAHQLLRSAFVHCNCAIILGPRQVGKTTLAREFADEFWRNWEPSLDYIDLEQEANRLQLQDIRAFIAERDREIIVLDEAHCLHEFFPQLRNLLDTSTNSVCGNVRWLILGSSTSEFEALVNSNLDGRHEKIYLPSIQLPELYDAYVLPTTTSIEVYDVGPKAISQSSRPRKLHELTRDLWLKGGFPLSFMANDIQASSEWRSQYINSVLGPHCPPRNNLARPDLLLSLWKRLAVEQGKCNVQKLPEKLGCDKNILNNLLKFLESGYLIRKVRPWHKSYAKREDKNPLWYIRDSGLLHSELNIDEIRTLEQNDAKGKSWEGFVLESIMSSAPLATEVFYFRDDRSHEADFILELDASRRWVIEVKFSGRRGVSKGFHRACEEVESERNFVIHGGPESFKSGKNSLDYFCLYDAVRELKIATRCLGVEQPTETLSDY